MTFLTAHLLAFIFGLLGNVVSFMVFLAPVPTFCKIYKRKSSEGFQSIPYAVALFSAMLLMYYALLKTNAYMILSINAIGCVIETSYLILYLTYAPKMSKMFTLRLILLFNIGAYGVLIVISILLVKGSKRVAAVGWMCAIFNLAVFASPLSIMRQVIRTKSVEFMPFNLSFFLTLCATMWFFYGFFIKDFYIAIPNVVGFLFGIAQMILYFIYKDSNKDGKTKMDTKNYEGTTDEKLVSIEMHKSCLDNQKQEDLEKNVKSLNKLARRKSNEEYPNEGNIR